jgi:hypothetical protein
MTLALGSAGQMTLLVATAASLLSDTTFFHHLLLMLVNSPSYTNRNSLGLDETQQSGRRPAVWQYGQGCTTGRHIARRLGDCQPPYRADCPNTHRSGLAMRKQLVSTRRARALTGTNCYLANEPRNNLEQCCAAVQSQYARAGSSMSAQPNTRSYSAAARFQDRSAVMPARMIAAQTPGWCQRTSSAASSARSIAPASGGANVHPVPTSPPAAAVGVSGMLGWGEGPAGRTAGWLGMARVCFVQRAAAVPAHRCVSAPHRH